MSDDFMAEGLEILRSHGFPVAGIHPFDVPMASDQEELVVHWDEPGADPIGDVRRFAERLRP